MAERQAYLCERSLKISKILGMLYNHDETSICRNLTVLTELTEEVIYNLHDISTGSCAEGTSISGSDMDIMFIICSIVVLKSSNDIPRDSLGRKSFFKMDFRQTRAGFCTLNVLELNEDRDIIEGINLKISDCLATYGDETYLTHTRLGSVMVESNKKLFSNVLPSQDFNVKNTYWNGPCVSSTMQCILGKSKYKCTDIACAIICPYWPDPAMEWVSRPRLHGWPSNELVDQLKQMHCHLLPVGDSESRKIDLEWRFAFVYQERELLWSFSTIQIQCYVILKALKKEFLSPVLHDEISSFHLKTVMFWLLENEGHDMWIEENLLQCVVICLEKLKECIHTMHLPHFFLIQRNLMFNKLKKAECRRKALSILTQVQENIYHSVCGVFSLFHFPDFYAENLINDLPIYGTNNADTRMFHYIRVCNSHLVVANSVDVLVAGVLQFSTSIKSLFHLLQTISVKGFDERCIRAFKTFLHIRMAIQIFANAQTPIDEHRKMICISIAHEIFKNTCGLDGMSGHLYYATFDLVRGEIEASIARVQGLFRVNRCLFYVGTRFRRRRIIIVNNGNVIQTEEDQYQNINLGSDECLALNVWFAPRDLVCLPDALKYECALQLGTYEIISIHPLVYSYFLLVTAFQLQGNAEVVDRYLDLLEGAVMDTEFGFGRHVGLNILGFAYYKACKLEKAFHIYCQSLQDYNSSNNAAVYHLCILVWTFCLEQEAKVA
ncbi:hypothetical protein ACJMK2_028213 [Sinanodonta woodiana]|uniref:Mab-21-like HhH/H2TH-like domain-containing protein n=1 Tax=Sinanodonta woodiana TaxID=1069815 RepID=A0ABD3X816_SINWO